MPAGGGLRWAPAVATSAGATANVAGASLHPETLRMTMRARPAPDRSIQMPIDPAVLDADLLPQDGFDTSWLDRRPQTDPLQYVDSDDVDGRLMWQRRGNVDEILARAGLFQGVEPSAVSALTKQLQPVDFPRGHTMFAEGEPGDRLYIIINGKVKIGRRSPTAARIC